MANYFIFPEKDNTLYSHPDRKSLNAGRDEILELVKEKGSSNFYHYPSRILIKFNDADIKTAIEKIGSSTFNNGTTKVSLQLTAMQAKNLVTSFNIQSFPVSHSWDEGTGKYLNIPSGSNGSSWLYRDNSINKTEWTTASFGVGSTGSISSSLLTEGGGNWYTGSNFESTQQFLIGADLNTNLDVTHVIQKWSSSIYANQTYPDGISNNGFIIMEPKSVEANVSGSSGELQYFSTDTHTIYPPKLNFKWDDSSYSAPSNKSSGDLNVVLYNLKKEYNQNEEAKLNIHVRDRYPTRTFVTSSNFLDVGYFKQTSYYSIRDGHTEEEVIPFDDNFTKLSADNNGMYFNLSMKGLQPERYYRILIKHINNDGTTIYDNKYIFKVIR
tara:strand:+ start:6350 stop:7498 length:1149 start_codon:yes stop_codon:yes gene_type:complete